MTGAGGLFGGGEGNDVLPPRTVSKKGFAAALGLSPARITAMIAAGLPVEPNGRIDLIRGRQWYEANTDPNRRRGGAGRPADGGIGRTARSRLDEVKAEREALRLGRERGELVELAEIERATFERARGERDRWIGWTSRVAATIAADTGADPAALFAALDREVRQHLVDLAETPIEDLDP